MANLQALQVSKPFSKALRIILSLVQVNLRQGEMEIHIWRETSLVPSCPSIPNIPADFHVSPALRMEGGFWCFKACSPPFSFKHSHEFNFLMMNLWHLHHQERKSRLSCIKFFSKVVEKISLSPVLLETFQGHWCTDTHQVPFAPPAFPRAVLGHKTSLQPQIPGL